MVTYYYNYLKKLSYSYDDIKICFHLDEKFSIKLVENNISLIQLLSKLQNILKYLIQIFSLIEASLVELTPYQMIKQIAYFCFTDCYHYYTYINQLISPLLEEFFTLTNQDALLLYEIYSEHIITTRKMKQIYSWQNKLQEFSVLTPEFFVLDKEYNTKIELYIRSLRDNSIMSHAQNPAENCSFSMITDASRILNDFMVQNHKNSFYRKTVFEAPRTAAGNKSKKDSKRVHPHGIKIIHTMPNLLSRKTDFTQRTLEIQNTAIDVSANFEGGLGGDGNRPHMALSTCPLTGGESFLREDHHGNILENMTTNMQNAY